MSEEQLAASQRQQKLSVADVHELEGKNAALQNDNVRISKDVSVCSFLDLPNFGKCLA